MSHLHLPEWMTATASFCGAVWLRVRLMKAGRDLPPKKTQANDQEPMLSFQKDELDA